MRIRLVLLIMMVLCASASVAAYGEGGLPLSMDDQVSVTISSAPFLAAKFKDRRLNRGIIYYEHPKLQLPKMRRMTMAISSVTVRVALDELLRGDTTYSWVADGNVAVFIPRIKINGLLDPTKTLSQIMPRFDVTDSNIVDAVEELKRQAAKQGLTGLPKPTKGWIPVSKMSPYTYDWQFSLHLKNKSIRECLDAIVEGDPPATWIAIPFPGYVFIAVSASNPHMGRLRRKP